MGAFKRMLIICLAASMTLGISAIVGPEFFARMFTDKKELVDLTASVMPVYFFGITILGSRWHVSARLSHWGRQSYHCLRHF